MLCGFLEERPTVIQPYSNYLCVIRYIYVIYNDTLFVHFRVTFLYVMTSSLIYIVYWLQWSFGFFEVQFKLHKPTCTIDSAVTMYISPI